MTLYPRFTFGKIQGVETVSYSNSRGIQPGVCTVRMPFSPNVDSGPYPMVWSDGVRSFSLPNCIVGDVDASVDGDGGQTMVIAIFDRRWRWKFGQISGRYNIRSGGQFQDASKKRPRDLTKLLFEAMGESKFDASLMPNDTFPMVDWNLEVPAKMLDQLCQSLNSHICYGHDDVFRIIPDGYGKDIPDVPSSSVGKGFDFGIRPGKVGVASGLFAWQLDFPLTPVGLDTDGKVKPIEKLTYKPKGDGWGDVVPATMNGIQDLNSTKTDERKLARETVWRWYLIGLPKIKVMPVAKLKIESIQQFFPLLDKQLEYETLTEVAKVSSAESAYDKDVRQRLPQEVWGLFYDEAGTGADNVDDFFDSGYTDLHTSSTDSNGVSKLVNAKLIYPKSFSIDQERRLVVFADPVYRFIERPASKNKSLMYGPPKLYLRTAVNFFNGTTRAGFRLDVTESIGGKDKDLTEWTSREDIIPEWREKTGGEVDNFKETKAGLEYYLKYAILKYDDKVPAHIEVPWLFPFSPDGRIAQVTFAIDGQGFIGTTINKEVEGLDTPVTYKERLKEVSIEVSQQRIAKLYGKQDDKKGKQ